MTGPQLRLRRLAAGVPAVAVARAMGCDPSGVTHLEQRLTVIRSATVERYLRALLVASDERDRERRELGRQLIQAGQEILAGRGSGTST